MKEALRVLLAIALALTLALVVMASLAYPYFNYILTAASITPSMDGGGAVLAASDLTAFGRLQDSTQTPPDLRSSGRIFPIAVGTRCKLLRSDQSVHCGPRNRFPAQEVLLKGGPSKGRVVWVCSTNAPPLTPIF